MIQAHARSQEAVVLGCGEQCQSLLGSQLPQIYNWSPSNSVRPQGCRGLMSNAPWKNRLI